MPGRPITKSGAAPGAEAAPRPRPILVVDDDRTLRFLYRRTLESGGFVVIEAEDGAAALEQFERHRPSIVLLDVLMPKMDGFSTCAALRATEHGRDAAVLMATSLDGIASIERAYDVGATDFITKPINWKILVQRIRYMLRADDAHRNLQRSQRRLAEAQRIASLGSFEWAIGAPAVACSPELSRIFGIAGDRGSLSLRALLRRIAPPERKNLLAAVRHALDRGAPLDQDAALRSSGDPTAFIDIRGEIVTDSDGQTMLLGTVQDISARKNQEAALVAARRAAESADAVKGALLAGMNHELRTPLNAIIGFSELITGEMLGPLGDKQYKEFAADILQAGRHMLDLVSNVLDMAKLASQHYELNREPADLRAIANSAVAMIATTPAAQGRRIELVGWQLPTFANVDVRAVKKMLIHLLSNAVKFSAAGTPIEITCVESRTGEISIAVTDQGIGMTPDEMTVAIEPFRQIDNRLERKFEGLGIGLSIVKQLVECHGGRLAVESRTGNGTTITLTFPASATLSLPFNGAPD